MASPRPRATISSPPGLRLRSYNVLHLAHFAAYGSTVRLKDTLLVNDPEVAVTVRE